MKKRLFYTVLIILTFVNVNAYDKIIIIDPGHNWDNTTGVLTPAKSATEVLTAGAAAIGKAGSGWGWNPSTLEKGGHFFTKSRVALNVSLASTNGFSVSAINNHHKGLRGKELWGKALKDGMFAGISAGALTLPFVKPELFPPLTLEKAGFYAGYDKFSYIGTSYSSVLNLRKIIDGIGL